MWLLLLLLRRGWRWLKTSRRWCRHLLLRPFPLLLITHSSRFRLKISHFSQIKPHCSCTKRVPFGPPSMLLIRRSQPSDQRVKTPPRLSQRTRTGSRGVRQAEERAGLVMDFGLPKLIEVAEEFQHVGPAAHGKRERWTVVPEVLAEGVPVPTLLVLVAAWRGGASG